MLRLSKISEYGLIAMKALSENQQALSAREIAESYQLPLEMTAKTLQKLKEQGWIESFQGSKGGYVLNPKTHRVDFADYLNHMEASSSMVDCARDSLCGCSQLPRCEIRPWLLNLNERLQHFLKEISLGEMLKKSTSTTHRKISS